jgi:hypothetical protein
MKINTKAQYLFVDYRDIRSSDILLIFCSKEIKARNNIIFIFDATSRDADESNFPFKATNKAIIPFLILDNHLKN